MTRPWPRSAKPSARRRRAFDRKLAQRVPQVVAGLRAGLSLRAAAEGAGVGYWTVRRWLALGAEGRAVLPRDAVFVELRKAWRETCALRSRP